MKNNRPASSTLQPGYGPLPTARVRWRQARLSAPRARILDVLTGQPDPCTVTALAVLTRHHPNTTRHHPNTIREHLDGLVNDGLALRTRAQAVGRGRPAWLYGAATEAGSDGSP